MKYKIIGIKNIDNVHYYNIKKDKDIHGAFCGLLVDLGINKDDVLREVDILFDDLDNEFIYVTDNKLDVYFFITKEYVNLVIKTDIIQEKLNIIIRKYFSFPE